MKWTLTLIALLAVPVAANAAELYMTGPASIAPGQDITIQVMLSVAEPWNGFDAAIAADQPGLTVKSRGVNMPAGTFWELGVPVGNTLAPKTDDVGLFNIGTNPWPAGDNNTQTIVLGTPSSLAFPLTLSFADPGAGINVAGVSGEIPVTTRTLVITPEPASLLLLALGGLFLRRR